MPVKGTEAVIKNLRLYQNNFLKHINSSMMVVKEMLDEKVTIILDQRQILELDEIILDKDKDAAYKFLEDYIYKPVKKSKDSHCKPPF